jgi:hypothetical protein
MSTVSEEGRGKSAKIEIVAATPTMRLMTDSVRQLHHRL